MPSKQTLTNDTVRSERIRDALHKWNLDALVCTLPENVLLLSGYWPVIGNAVALATNAGRIAVLAPEDELELARQGWADEVFTFAPSSLDHLNGTLPAVRTALQSAVTKLKVKRGRIGYERGSASVPASYAAIYLYEASRSELLIHALLPVTLVPGDALLAQLRSVPTPYELERIRLGCRLAERAFRVGALHLRGGLTETAVAALFGAPLGETAPELHSERAGGFTFCMSGVNAAQAYAAYQRSRSSVLQPGTLALVHCNSYVDGYWTDITRTFFLGAPDERARAMYATVFDARRAAFEAVRPGVRAAEVDSAAREVIKAHGFGAQFKHATGHGVGFAAIDHNAPPRLHPKSDDVLETGMVFNIEPGIYLEDFGGLRHCDMVAVTADGAELLTPFQTALDELIITTANTTSSAASAQTASRRKA